MMRKACGIALNLLPFFLRSRSDQTRLANVKWKNGRNSYPVGRRAAQIQFREGSEKPEAGRKAERRALESGYLHGAWRQRKAPAGAFFFVCTVLVLSGCASFNRHSVIPPVTAKIPASLKQACPGVVAIPEKDLTEGDIARLWAKDRTSLLICAKRHGALAKAASLIGG